MHPFRGLSGFLLRRIALGLLTLVIVSIVLLLGTAVFQWLPPDALIPPQDRPWDHFKELVLPVITLAVAVVPYIARFMRASLIEVLQSDYVEMARLKGLPERDVVLRHALP